MSYPALVRDKAILLRQKGYSVNEISSHLKIARSTAFDWTKNVKLSPQASKIIFEKKQKQFFKKGNTEWTKAKRTTPLKIWKRNDLKLLEKLYKSGLSIREVANKMQVSHASISHAMRRHNIPRRSASEADWITFMKKPPSYKKKSKLNLQERYLHVSTLMLYWAEGAKGKHSIDFTNSDSKMLILFLTGLREIFQIDENRLRAYLYCYSNQNIKELLKYWSSLLHIPLTQFSKPYVRKNFNPKKIGKMAHGVLHIRYSDKKLLMQIKAEIDIIQEQLIKLGWLSGQKRFSVKEMS